MNVSGLSVEELDRAVEDERLTFPAPVSLSELVATEAPAMDWLAKPIIPAGGNVLIAGYPKSFKTLAALDLAVSLASGTPFLGRFGTGRRRRVGIVLMEGLKWQAGRRLARLCAAHGIDPAEIDDRVYTWYQPTLRLVHLADTTGIAVWVERLGLDVVIVDAWAYVASGDSNDADSVTPQLASFSTISKHVPGTTLVLIHHARKQKEGGKDERVTDLIRGSGAFGAWYDCGIALSRKDEQSPVSVRIELRDYRTPEPFSFTIEDEVPASRDTDWQAKGALWLRASDKTPAELAADERAEERLLEVVRFVHEHEGCTATQIEEGFQTRPARTRAVRELAMRRGLIVDSGEEGNFKSMSYSITDAGLALVVPSSHRRPDDGSDSRRPVVPTPVGGDGGRQSHSDDDVEPGTTQAHAVKEVLGSHA